MGGPRRPTNRTARTAGKVTTLLLVALGVFVVLQRCDQMRDRADEYTSRGLDAWARQLQAEPLELNEAISAFEEAARASVDASYPLFYLSAAEEVLGRREYGAPPSTAWIEALDALRAGDLDDALRRFQTIGGENHRATLYVRLVRELLARTGS